MAYRDDIAAARAREHGLRMGIEEQRAELEQVQRLRQELEGLEEAEQREEQQEWVIPRKKWNVLPWVAAMAMGLGLGAAMYAMPRADVPVVAKAPPPVPSSSSSASPVAAPLPPSNPSSVQAQMGVIECGPRMDTYFAKRGWKARRR